MGDKASSFVEMLKKDNSVSIHHKKLQATATEMYKVSNNYSKYPSLLQLLRAFLHQGLSLITWVTQLV